MNLLDQYKDLHAHGKFLGLSLLPHITPIYKLIKKHGAKTLLDYGCGKGEQYFKHGAHKKWFRNWGIMPTLYDPGYEPFSKKPTGVFDGVICTDVMEHIPEEEVENVLDEIVSYATKFVFFNICIVPARKFLPDGRNVHLTVKPETWWKEKLSKYTDVEVVLVCTDE